MTDEPEPFVLRRRTLEEQVEYLNFQFSIVYAHNQKLRRDVESLQARLAAVERAIPWQAPKKPKPPIR